MALLLVCTVVVEGSMTQELFLEWLESTVVSSQVSDELESMTLMFF